MPAQNVYRFKSADEFRCIQDRCEYNCCSNWKIAIDKPALARYRESIPNVLEIIATSGSNDFLPRDEEERCKFLSQGKCSIHGGHGSEALPRICDKFPRVAHGQEHAEIQSVMPSCPEAARKILLNDEAFTLIHLNPGQVVDAPDIEEWAILSSAEMADLTTRFIDLFMNAPFTPEVTLFHLLRLMQRCDSVPMARWSEDVAAIGQSSPQDLTPLPPRNAMRSKRSIALVLEIIYAATDPALSSYKSMLESGLSLEFSMATPSAAAGDGLSARLKRELEVIEPWLRRHLAVAIASHGLPLGSQTQEGRKAGQSPSGWAKKIAADFLVVRYFLLCLVRHEGETVPSDNKFVDLLFRLYRTLLHSGMTEREEKEFSAMGMEDIVDQLLYL